MKRPFSIFLACLLVLLFAAAGTGLKFAAFLAAPVVPPEPRVLDIADGTSFNEVAGRLEEEGVVAGAFELRVLARLRDDARRIQAGEYEFSEASTPGRILARLVSGDVRQHRITIPEGWTLREIAALLEREGWGKGEEFLRLARDRAFLDELDIPAPSLEGYLFPETYAFVRGMTQRRQIRAMIEEFRARIAPEIVEDAKKRGLDLHQLVTLASIVQKEAGNAGEMPLIAAVFHNRLKRGIALQADPTVIYGIADFDGNLTRRHLRTPTPYNTYTRPGLPPGPIASPGEEALRAAARPAPVDYLYFVAKGDGTHVFSANLEDHNRAVRRYQLRR